MRVRKVKVCCLARTKRPARIGPQDTTPLDFGHELLPDDLSRMEWNFQKSVEIMPCLAEAGVKTDHQRSHDFSLPIWGR